MPFGVTFTSAFRHRRGSDKVEEDPWHTKRRVNWLRRTGGSVDVSMRTSPQLGPVAQKSDDGLRLGSLDCGRPMRLVRPSEVLCLHEPPCQSSQIITQHSEEGCERRLLEDLGLM